MVGWLDGWLAVGSSAQFRWLSVNRTQMKFIDRNRNRIGGGWPNQKMGKRRWRLVRGEVEREKRASVLGLSVVVATMWWGTHVAGTTKTAAWVLTFCQPACQPCSHAAMQPATNRQQAAGNSQQPADDKTTSSATLSHWATQKVVHGMMILGGSTFGGVAYQGAS